MRGPCLLLAAATLALAACLPAAPPAPVQIDVPVRTFRGHARSVTGLAVSPDGTLLASSSRDGSVRLWDLASGSGRAVLRAGHWLASTWTVAISPDGSRLVAGSDNLTLRVWSLPEARPVVTFRPHERSIRALAFSPDGRLLATGSRDDTAALWDTARWELVARLPAGNTVRAVAFTAGGARLLAGTADDVVLVWDVATRAPLAVLRGHTNSVQALAVAPGRGLLVSGSADQTLRLWDLRSSTPLGVLALDRAGALPTRAERYGLDPGPEVLALAASPDGRWVASAHRDRILRLWDLDARRLSGEIRSPAPTSYALLFHPGGQTLFSGGDDEAIHEWSLVHWPAAAGSGRRRA